MDFFLPEKGHLDCNHQLDEKDSARNALVLQTMKIRLSNNSIRIRINQDELLKLSQNETVSLSVRFSIYDCLICELTPWNLEVLEAKFESGKLTVNIPFSFTQNWPTHPTQPIEIHQNNGSAHALYILVEKDFEKG